MQIQPFSCEYPLVCCLRDVEIQTCCAHRGPGSYPSTAQSIQSNEGERFYKANIQSIMRVSLTKKIPWLSAKQRQHAPWEREHEASRVATMNQPHVVTREYHREGKIQTSLRTISFPDEATENSAQETKIQIHTNVGSVKVTTIHH